jgi:hypothetical protein
MTIKYQQAEQLVEAILELVEAKLTEQISTDVEESVNLNRVTQDVIDRIQEIFNSE